MPTHLDLNRAARELLSVIDGDLVTVVTDPRQAFPVHVFIDADLATPDDVIAIQSALLTVLDEGTALVYAGPMTGTFDRIPVLVTTSMWQLRDVAVPA